MTDNQKKLVREYIMGYNLEEYSSENLYRNIYKMPVKTYFEGIIDRHNINITVEDIKAITKQIIEDSTGFELTFIDNEWDDLKMEEEEIKYKGWNTNEEKVRIKRNWNTNKKYMIDFFEL